MDKWQRRGFLVRIRNGQNCNEASAAVGLSKFPAYQLRKTDPEFRKEFEEAYRIGEENRKKRAHWKHPFRGLRPPTRG